MTEEEKKAIEDLKEEINKPLEVPEDKFDTFILYNIESARIILNLIEKLQKENKELKKSKDNIQVVYGGRNYGKTNSIVKEYISKDKIREKIKEKEAEKQGVKNISLEEYAITSKELKESEICLLKCLLEEK